MKKYQKILSIFALAIIASCYGGYGDSAVDARIYRNISKKCKNATVLENCRNNYFSKMIRDKNGKIIIDDEGKRIRDENGKVIIPQDYQSKGWMGKFFVSTNQQISAMEKY